MKKFNKKQLASWINKAVEESSSAYIPFPIADHIAEQDAEERIEALKARAVEACCFACTQSGAGCDHRLRTDDYYLCDILNNFIQKLNEQ